MKLISWEQVSTLRKERNAELLRRMENGEKLTSFNSVDSWYPPRPIVEKDREAIERLYGKMVDDRLVRAARSGGDSKKSVSNSEDKNWRPLRLA